MNSILLILSILLLPSCEPPQSAPPITIKAVNEKIKVGAERLDEYLPLLSGKRVAVVANQTSLVAGTHLVDTLISRNVEVVKALAAEHGFRGNKSDGVHLNDEVDPKTGIPIVSIYGKGRKPSAETLADVDVVIFDIQDVGVRFYTFISTMHLVMEACAENGKQVIVLDRPNPNGMYIDGPILEPASKSFLGMHPIPIVHGLTVGELAQMINGEGWLNGGIKCRLKVIPVDNYSHKQSYNLPVKPSPNLPNDLSIRLYPSLALFEQTDISLGRGTLEPFLQIGHPSFKEMSHTFTPKSIKGMSLRPPLEGQKCYGITFKNDKVKPGFTLKYLIRFYKRFEDKPKFFKESLHLLAGNRVLQRQIINGLSEEQIKATWQADLRQYKAMRKKYLLYEDFE